MVRQTSCNHCGLDIENFSPYRRGQWRDRGNNSTCPTGTSAGKAHAPYKETYSVWIDEGRGMATLSHKGKTEWSRRTTAQRHCNDWNKSNPGRPAHVVRAN